MSASNRDQLAPLILALVILTILLYVPAAGFAEEPSPANGVFISVYNPITDAEVGRIREVTAEASKRHRGSAGPAAMPLKIVYDFNPAGQSGGTSVYDNCRGLAAFLLGLTDVTTIAFVHGEVSRHTVLPVLACQELVMARDAKIGAVVREQDEPLWKDQMSFYKDVAEKRGRSPAIVLKMLDKDLEVYEAVRNGAVWYVDGQQAPEPGVVVNRGRGPVLARGTTASLSTPQAQRFGLCKLSKENRAELASWFGMPRDSLRDDPLQGRVADAWRIEVRGQLTRPLEETLKRRIGRVISQKANFLIFQLECGGGEPAVAGSLAEYIADLKDYTGKRPVMTVAYVSEQARDTALFLALACTRIVMHQHAELGDFESYLQKRPRDQAAMSGTLRDLAQKNYYPPLLARGFVEPELALYRVHARKDPRQHSVVSEDELQINRDQWIVDDSAPLKPRGQYLTIKPATARELGLAQHLVENVGQLYEAYRLDPAKVRQAGPDWLDRFATFLRHPTMAVILVMLGITCLILELKMPGISLPGVVSALCFVLFFWAHAQLEYTWLALLLFLLGLVFLALEIFVVPGFAVLGFSGIALILIGLGLATLEGWPQTESEWLAALSSVGRFGLGLVGAVVAAVVGARYLPHIPYANRLVLMPPAEREEEPAQEPLPASVAHFRTLLGAIGVSATPLRPAGTARIGEEYIDVVAEGSFVPPGARVQVIEVEGNRVVVKEL